MLNELSQNKNSLMTFEVVIIENEKFKMIDYILKKNENIKYKIWQISFCKGLLSHCDRI